MKTQNQWFSAYAESHQNALNQKIHFVCVPTIYFAIFGMLLSIPSEILNSAFGIEIPFLLNWAVLISIPVLWFYARLSLKSFVLMFLFTLFSLVVNFYLAKFVHLFYFNLSLFVIAWIGQFYGHKVEGKKPSFFEDLQFLLIGPIWVFEKMTR